MSLFTKLLSIGANNTLKRYQKRVQDIEKLAPAYKQLTDTELRDKTEQFKQELANGKTLNDILPDAFATVREASTRILGKTHYPVQLIGGMALHEGKIAELATGEGKSIPVNTLIPLYDGNFKQAGDVIEGDVLVSAEGTPTKVLGVYPQGNKQTMEVQLIDGSIAYASPDHLWSCTTERSEIERIFTTQHLYDGGIKKKDGTYKWYLPAHPEYVTLADNINELSQYLKEYQNDINNIINITFNPHYGIKSDYEHVKRVMFMITMNNYDEKIANLLRKTGVYFEAINNATNAINIYPTKQQLQAFSITIPFNIGSIVETISESDQQPPKKLAVTNITNIKQETEQVCFLVDNERHLFLTEDYVVTHNTLVSLLPGYLNALTGKGVHIITVNDYLAERDKTEMSKVYNALGISVGRIWSNMSPVLRKQAYDCDITYGINSEFGFDYLKDNMVTDPTNRVQRGLEYVIVDEIDSILIDEARTPLIIAGEGSKAQETYYQFANVVRGLKETTEDAPEDGDFIKDEAKRTVILTDEGLNKVEERLGFEVYNDTSSTLQNHLKQALTAEYLFEKDVNYVVDNGEVKIVDDFTGRIMDGRRYSEGLHQAIEAKEGVEIKEENNTIASITLQNYFRLYNKLSGMTGTAKTEDSEFKQIYNLEVVSVPRNKPSQRIDYPDAIYRTHEAKLEGIVKKVKEKHAKGQPVLIGTTSVEQSEELSQLLNKNYIPHKTLNAKNHALEAKIIANAGRLGAVTVATNMAGRGTDILLGGNPETMANSITSSYFESFKQVLENNNIIDPDPITIWFAESIMPKAFKAEMDAKCAEEKEKVEKLGGLCVIGSVRHESRRIDNQLRGRSARQGDPGETQFYLSLDDKLVRLFGKNIDTLNKMMAKAYPNDDQPIESKRVSKAVEGAQEKIEGINFEQRKNVLEYDDVMDKQRKVIYKLRNEILDSPDIADKIPDMITRVVERSIPLFTGKKTYYNEGEDTWDLEGIDLWIQAITGNDSNIEGWVKNGEDTTIDELINKVITIFQVQYNYVKDMFTTEIFRPYEATMLLNTIDNEWLQHLDAMDYLKTGIGLRGYGQRDPKVEYKQDAFEGFKELIYIIEEHFLAILFHTEAL